MTFIKFSTLPGEAWGVMSRDYFELEEQFRNYMSILVKALDPDIYLEFHYRGMYWSLNIMSFMSLKFPSDFSLAEQLQEEDIIKEIC